ncbi:unnamed protein product [Paramecium primaurelia]|uniref:Uncharacterized protein n=1 Tax=Paramecium primaurelia TaxID=5886 RepID=A0A8S1KCP4_PARPR|nr:unnamed protein product [Paramecium primaurelia]
MNQQQQYYQQEYQAIQQPRIKKAKSFDEDDNENLEIIKQGYGIHEALRIDILEFYKSSRTQQEYKNPADFVKHRLDGKYGPYWFVFMWEHKNGLNAQYSYYNNDDKVFEFKLNGWHVLIYSFNQTQQPAQFKPQPNAQTIPQYNTQFPPPLYDQKFDDYQVDPRYPYSQMQQGPSQFRQGGWYY